MKAAVNYTTPFTFQTNLTGISSFSASSCNPVLALLGNGEEKDSIISKFGGEIKRDNFNIAIKNSVGMDRGFYIRSVSYTHLDGYKRQGLALTW